ncbi:zinc finger, CCHC-type containing protein [Tanacetum coccineum]
MAAAAMKHMASNFAKLDMFKGVDFRRWQKKTHFFLSSISVVYVLTTPIPKDGENATVDQIRRRAKWDNDDYVLEAKYMAEDTSSKKFLVSNFTNYKMTDSRPVMQQYNELLCILGRFTQHKMNMDEAIQLGIHLHIEESLRVHDSDKPKGNNVVGPHDLCDLHATPLLENKKYFVKFIDDASRTESRVLGVWGRIAVIRLPNPKLKTLGERGIECIFVGYAEHSKAFRFSLVPKPSQRSLINETKDIGGLVVPEELKEQGMRSLTNTPIALILRMIPRHLMKQSSPRMLLSGKKQSMMRWIPSWATTLRQKSGIDYFDTYASVAHISTIRLLIAMASIHNLIIHQMDVKTAFLNGELDEEFDEVVLSSGYLLNQADKYVYSKFDKSGKGVIICLYVDDMLIFSIDQVQVDMTKEFLSSKFSMNDMREANVILVSTPMDTSEKLMPNNGQAISQLEYTSNPGIQHWQAIQRVLKYLKKTMDYSLIYTGYPSVLEGYTDARWISNAENNSSTSGWVFLLSGAAGKEAEWLRHLILEISLWSKPITPISIRYDSAATLAKAYSEMYNGKSRHLGVKHSMIHELITNGVVSIEFVRSQRNLADHLMKGLARHLVLKYVEGMWTEAHIFKIILRMCLKPAEKEDEVFTS